MIRPLEALLVISCFASGACDEGVEPPAQEPARSTVEEPTSEPAAEAPAEAESQAEAESEADSEAEAPEAMLERAREAATAAETGSTYCESAYRSLQAMQAQVAAQYPDQVRPMPDESAFTAVCEDLPEAAQRCLIPRHAMENSSQCERTAAALPPNLRDALEEVLGG